MAHFSGPLHSEIYCKPPILNMTENITEWIKIAHPIKERSDHEYVIDFCNVFEDVTEHIQDYFKNASENIDLYNIPKNNQKLVPCTQFEEKPIYNSVSRNQWNRRVELILKPFPDHHTI